MQRALIKVTFKLLDQPLKSSYFAFDNPFVAAGLNFNRHLIVWFIQRHLESIRNCGLCNNIVRLDYSAPTSAGADV